MAKRCGPYGCPRANWWKQTLGTDYYYSGGSEALPEILLSEDFTGTSVDTAKGTITNPDSANILVSQNNALIFKRVTDGTISGFLNYWQSTESFSKDNVLQVNVLRTTGFINSVVRAGFFIDESNRINFATNPGDGTVNLAITVGGVSAYFFQTALSTNVSRTLKITYDTNNDAKFWHYTGGAWVQLGTTQNVNIGSSFYVRLSASSSASDAANDLFTIDTLRVAGADYSTETP